MATNGLEITLPNGLVRRFVNLPDISSAQALVSARGQDADGNDLKAKLVNSRLSFSAAGEISVFAPAGETLAEPKTFDAPAGAAIIIMTEDDQIISEGNNVINIQSDQAISCKGFVDLLVGISP